MGPTAAPARSAGTEQEWTEAFSERSLEVRADLTEHGEVRIVLQDTCGLAVRSWSPGGERFASATVSPAGDPAAEVRSLLDWTSDRATGTGLAACARLAAPALSDVDPEAVVRGVHEVLAGYRAGVAEGGAARGRAVVRLRLRRYHVAGAGMLAGPAAEPTTGSGGHIHMFGDAFQGLATGGSGLACSGLAELSHATGHRLGRRVAEQAVRLAGARAAQTGAASAVFGPVAAGVLVHEVIGHALEAGAALAGSALWRLRGERFGHPELEVHDDGREAEAWERLSADEEGTPLGHARLITGGRVVGMVTDRMSAQRLELDRSSGHGRRGGFAHRPSARVRHTVVTGGRDDPAGIIADTRAGVLVESVDTGEADVRDGRFTIRVREGRQISDGRLGPLLAGFTVTGSLADFGRLDAIGGDGTPYHTLCGMGSHWLPVSGVTPTLRLPRVEVHAGQS